jgi:predicted phage terminase large subunit-like protein
MMPLTNEERLALLQLIKRKRPKEPPWKLYDFVREAWPIIDPAPFVGGWNVEAICEHLEACSSGDIRRLIINVPPGSSKTMIALIMWPAWEWTWRPDGKWMCATYEVPLSYTKSKLCMRLLESEWYQERWGDSWEKDSKEWAAGMMVNDAGGFRYATGKGSGATGRHADRQIVDDPHKPQDILSGALSSSVIRADCENTYQWWTQTMATRLIAAPGIRPVRVVIMQRLHEADLTGKLQKEFGDEYEHLMIPQRFEPDRKCITVLKRDPETKEPVKIWEDPRTEPGELMCPERMNEEFCNGRKKELGSKGYAAQEQQRPTPSGGGVFKREWFKFYKSLPAKAYRNLLQSWDCSFKDLVTSDFVVGQVWAQYGPDYYLLDQVRDRMTFSGTLIAVNTLSGKWPRAHLKLIEDKANGTAVIDVLKNKISGIVPVSPLGGKEVRANACEPIVEAGNVYLPDPSIAPWVNDYIEEMVSFPGVFDDQVDATTQALNYMLEKNNDMYRLALEQLG